MVIHKGLEKRWHQMSLYEQMGNIGSDVGKALNARAEGKSDREQAALDRALELFDFTIADPKHRFRLRELCRAREVLCDYFFGDNVYGSTPENMEGYFMAFALAARKNR